MQAARNEILLDLDRAADELRATYANSARLPVAEYMIRSASDHAHRLASMIEMIRSHSGRLLDIGFNPVVTHAYLTADIEAHLIGFDDYGPDEKPRSSSWKLRGRDVPTHDLNIERHVAPYDAEAFDIVVFLEVFEHLSTDPMHALAEINRLTRIGGTLIFSTPNITSARSIERLLRGASPYVSGRFMKARSTNRHNREYTPKELRLLMEAAGYRVDILETPEFYQPRASSDVWQWIEKSGASVEFRGDTVVMTCTKTSGVVERYPDFLYFPAAPNRYERIRECQEQAAFAMSAGQTSAAEPYLRELVELEPQSPSAHSGLAQALEEQERFAEATLSYSNALQRTDRARSASVQVGFDAVERCLWKSKDPELARQVTQALASKFEGSPPHCVLAARVLHALGSPTDARVYLQRALQSDGKNERARVLLQEWFDHAAG